MALRSAGVVPLNCKGTRPHFYKASVLLIIQREMPAVVVECQLNDRNEVLVYFRVLCGGACLEYYRSYLQVDQHCKNIRPRT
jgi:hypothetical protein